MSKDKLLKNIEDGLLNFYLENDYSIESNNHLSESDENYDGQIDKYDRISKQLLFKAKAQVRKNRIAKVISIAEASGRLKSFDGENKKNVFSIFKKHIEQHGLAANYRNFDKMTEDEMINILEQLDLTTLFNEIDENLSNE